MSIQSNNLRALCALWGITQEELARLVGVDRRSVSRWVNDAGNRMQVVHRDALCEAFGITAHDVESEGNGLAARLARTLVAAGWDARRAGLPQGARVSWLRGVYEDEWHGKIPLPAHATVPLLSAGQALGGDVPAGVPQVEVLPSLIDRHPAAFAVAVPDASMDRSLPVGYHAIVDPGKTSCAGSIALVDVSGVALLRRVMLGRDKALLSADGSTGENDQVLEAREVRVVGAVVWCQPEAELA